MSFIALYGARADELTTLADSADRYVARSILPHIDAWEETGAPPLRQLLRDMGELGFIGLDLPADLGGLGLDFLHVYTVAECLGSIPSLGLSAALAAHAEQAVALLYACGSDADRQHWLPLLVRGEHIACALPADLHGDHRSAAQVPGLLDADILVRPGCVQRLEQRPAAAPLLGMWAARMGKAEDAHPPAGSFDRQSFDDWRTRCRVLEAARSLRWMERIIAQTHDYTGQRIVFGRPLLERQAVGLRLTELQVEIDALRAMCMHAAILIHRAAPKALSERFAAGAQWKAAALQHRVADQCLQFWGGMGFMAESPTARAWRDSLYATLGGAAPILSRVAAAQERL